MLSAVDQLSRIKTTHILYTLLGILQSLGFIHDRSGFDLELSLNLDELSFECSDSVGKGLEFPTL